MSSDLTVIPETAILYYIVRFQCGNLITLSKGYFMKNQFNPTENKLMKKYTKPVMRIWALPWGDIPTPPSSN